MKSMNFVIFFSVFFAIYFLINYYIFIRGYQALSTVGHYRVYYVILFWFLACAYIAARFMERTPLHLLHDILYWAGSIWFAIMLYFFLTVVVIDLVRLFNIFFHFLPDKQSVAYENLKVYTTLFSAGLIAVLIAYGVWNAFHPTVRNVEITIDKKAGTRKELTIAMVSDIHMGSLFTKSQIRKMVAGINSLKPDMVLLAGDILDEVQAPIFRENTGEPIKNIQAPLGVYGITGNHEYIGGINRAAKYIESLNVNLLRDSCILVDSSFWLAGREDKDMERFTGKKRKEISDILAGIDKTKPIILMDHQPFKLSAPMDNGVDLQLSGHTHHGQLWPLNYITKKTYEVSWGYKLKKQLHVYVSCGYGFWGPQARIGNRPEIVNISINFR